MSEQKKAMLEWSLMDLRGNVKTLEDGSEKYVGEIPGKLWERVEKVVDWLVEVACEGDFQVFGLDEAREGLVVAGLIGGSLYTHSGEWPEWRYVWRHEYDSDQVGDGAGARGILHDSYDFCVRILRVSEYLGFEFVENALDNGHNMAHLVMEFSGYALECADVDFERLLAISEEEVRGFRDENFYNNAAWREALSRLLGDANG